MINSLTKILASVLKFSEVTFSTCHILLQNGFCRPKELDTPEAENCSDSEDEDGDGQGPQGLADADQTQMDGAKDVTDQIEEEWQLEGLRKEEEVSFGPMMAKS